MSTVAIIMTTYNGEKYLGEQIASILASTYQDFELYLYDDGSSDTTISILESYQSSNSDKIHVIRNKKNYGVTLNFLQALAQTAADYVMFCDQDDVWLPNKIAVTIKRMRHMEAQFSKDCPIAVFTDAVVVDQNLATLQSSFFASGHLNPRRTDLAHLLMENKLIGCTVMVNAALRKVLHTHRLPQRAKYHDWWIALIAAAFGKIGYVEEGTLLYRQHGGNIVGESGFSSYIKNRISNLGKQKESLAATFLQAEEFLAIYGGQIPEESRELIKHFADLGQLGFIEKRREVLQYHFYKTGLLRNIGLMLIL